MDQAGKRTSGRIKIRGTNKNNELGKRGIEKVLQGEIGDIEKDVKSKEIH